MERRGETKKEGIIKERKEREEEGNRRTGR